MWTRRNKADTYNQSDRQRTDSSERIAGFQGQIDCGEGNSTIVPPKMTMIFDQDANPSSNLARLEDLPLRNELATLYESGYQYTGNRSKDLVQCVLQAIHAWKTHYNYNIPDAVLLNQVITLFNKLKDINRMD